MKKVTKHLKPQTQLVLDHLTTYGHITPVEAGAVYKIRCLPKRISELKEAGVLIQTQLRSDATGQRYAHYSL